MTTAATAGPVTFVLSGGAGLGAIQVGMLRALADRGVFPDMIVATSVGAINGAFIASHGPTSEAVDELAAVWRSVRRAQIFPLDPLTGLLGFLGAKRNLVPGARSAVSSRATCSCSRRHARSTSSRWTSATRRR